MSGVTQDFVESFRDETDFSGVFFTLLLTGVDEKDELLIPIGLDVEHPMVKEILDRARAARSKNGEAA